MLSIQKTVNRLTLSDRWTYVEDDEDVGVEESKQSEKPPTPPSVEELEESSEELSDEELAESSDEEIIDLLNYNSVSDVVVSSHEVVVTSDTDSIVIG